MTVAGDASPMPALRAVAVALLVVLAGCAGASLPADEPDAVTTTTTSPTTTTGEPTTMPLPEPPDELTHENVTAFVVAHEEALLYNRAIADHDRANVGCEVRWANRTGDAFRVRVGCGVSTYDYHADDDVTAVGDGFSRAVYVVNESGVDRTEQ